MKQLSMIGKILAGLAGLLCVVILSTAIHLGVTVAGSNLDESAAVEDEYEVVFSGNITINDEPYEVVLKGNDGTFTVDANTLENVTSGTYTYTKGQGWTFSFNDNKATHVRTHYDEKAGEHGFSFLLNLGSRGNGMVHLVREDGSFKVSDPAWEDLPAFAGTADWFGGSLSAEVFCSCDDAGGFQIFCTGGEINEITGKYTGDSNGYTFTTADGATFTTAPDAETGRLSLTVRVHRPQLEAYGAADTDAYLVMPPTE